MILLLSIRINPWSNIYKIKQEIMLKSIHIMNLINTEISGNSGKYRLGNDIAVICYFILNIIQQYKRKQSNYPK